MPIDAAQIVIQSSVVIVALSAALMRVKMLRIKKENDEELTAFEKAITIVIVLFSVTAVFCEIVYLCHISIFGAYENLIKYGMLIAVAANIIGIRNWTPREINLH